MILYLCSCCITGVITDSELLYDIRFNIHCNFTSLICHAKCSGLVFQQICTKSFQYISCLLSPDSGT